MKHSEHVNQSGHLDVGNGHCLYWEDWGNPSAITFFSFHGGPGEYFNDSHKALFDPQKHRVIFHDQRGCGRSTPFASTENNTTQHLLTDIEKLREHLAIESAHVVGGSWGSALALLYAIAYPQRVRSLIIRGVYLLRDFEDNWVNEGYPRYQFPQEWERFISLVPEESRTSGVDIMQYYANQMRSDDPEIAHKHAVEWTTWEYCLCSLEYDPAANRKEITQDPNTLAVSLLETHYFLNKCFVEPNPVLSNIDRIKHIPCQIVQGRFDMCTPAVSAWDLHNAYGDNSTLTWVNTGHIGSEPAMLAALQKAVLTVGNS